jgi:hypothetical protein
VAFGATDVLWDRAQSYLLRKTKLQIYLLQFNQQKKDDRELNFHFSDSTNLNNHHHHHRHHQRCSKLNNDFVDP